MDDDKENKEIEKGVEALEIAKQSEASLNNLLELEDKEDELLLQWEEQKAIKEDQKGKANQNFKEWNFTAEKMIDFQNDRPF